MGHIIRWNEDGDFDADDVPLEPPSCSPATRPTSAPEARGNIQGDIFACPDGLMLDARGVLWIQTDMSTRSQMHQGELKRIGNNQMLACDPATGEMRRFLTGPVGCEITGVDADARRTHDVRQHPAPGRAAHPAQRRPRDPQPAQRSRAPEAVLELARLQAGRAAALGHRRDTQEGRRADRDVSPQRRAGETAAVAPDIHTPITR